MSVTTIQHKNPLFVEKAVFTFSNVYRLYCTIEKLRIFLLNFRRVRIPA